MNYLFALIAFLSYLGVDTKGMSPNLQMYTYLTKLASVEELFLVIFGVVIVIGLVMTVLMSSQAEGAGCGCTVILMAVVLFGINLLCYFLTQGMISSFSPELGVVEPVKFYVCLIIFILLGAG
jgi:hypothetical protein